MRTIEAAARPVPRRSDAGQMRFTDRDVTGLLLLAEHYAAPYDLLSAARVRACGADTRGRRPLACRRPGGQRQFRARPGVVLAHHGRDGRDRPGVLGAADPGAQGVVGPSAALVLVVFDVAALAPDGLGCFPHLHADEGGVGVVVACNRRMSGKTNPGRAPGRQYYYYVCPHNPNNPRDAQTHPGHIRAAVRERAIHAAVDTIITGLLSHDRAAMLAGILPATQDEHDQQSDARAEELRKQIAQNETAQHGLITQLERLGSDTTPAADAMRQRITDQFTDRYNQARELQAQLDQIQAARPATQDPTLIDELPYATANLAAAPDDIKAKLYAAFGIQVLYRAPKKQATIWATITPTTPGIVAALTTDPRTDHDTACGNLTTAPIAPYSTQ